MKQCDPQKQKLLQKYEQPWANGNVLNQKNWNDCLTFVLTGGVNFHNTFEVGKFGAELRGGSSKILFAHNQLHSISRYNERNVTAHLRYEFPPFSEDHRMRCQTPHFSWREGRITQDKNDLTPPGKHFLGFRILTIFKVMQLHQLIAYLQGSLTNQETERFDESSVFIAKDDQLGGITLFWKMFLLPVCEIHQMSEICGLHASGSSILLQTCQSRLSIRLNRSKKKPNAKQPSNASYLQAKFESVFESKHFSLEFLGYA